MILYNIHDLLGDLFVDDKSLSMIIRHEISFPNLEQSLNLLDPWLIQLDLEASNQTDL